MAGQGMRGSGNEVGRQQDRSDGRVRMGRTNWVGRDWENEQWKLIKELGLEVGWRGR